VPETLADRIEWVERRRRETARGLLDRAAAIVGAAAAAPDAEARPCFVCGHAVSDHRRASTCGCCSKGVRVVRPGTDLMAEGVQYAEDRVRGGNPLPPPP
jgi:hypothetical protein